MSHLNSGKLILNDLPFLIKAACIKIHSNYLNLKINKKIFSFNFLCNNENMI
jgi:hypothetical protein